jgi:signal transduction histidine kinase
MWRVPAAVLGAILLGITATLAVVLVPGLRFAYRQPSLHVAVETTASLTALLACFLIVGRFRRQPRLNELVLASALGVLAFSNLFFATLPALAEQPPDTLRIWAAITGRSLGALLFAVAAFAPRRLVMRPARALVGAAAGVTVLLLATGLLVLAFDDHLPRAIGVELTPETSGRPNLHASAWVLAVQLVVAALYALAAVGFLKRSQRLGDEFFGWLAVAGVLAMFSRFNYFLYPSLYSDWVYTGDLFRIGFYAVLFTGSIREIGSYGRTLSHAVVLEERRRIARDLHDGLAQEIAYISRNLDSLADALANEDVIGRLRGAIARAQTESRRAINALAPRGTESADFALAEAASEVAERFKLDLDLDLAAGVQVSAMRREALVRIACEAITNAAVHSGERRVRLSLERDGARVRLRVKDGGSGFDPAVTNGGGFGLTAMRERARAVGGELRVQSTPGRGTEVEVAL